MLTENIEQNTIKCHIFKIISIILKIIGTMQIAA
jgi:hypothetical protein